MMIDSGFDLVLFFGGLYLLFFIASFVLISLGIHVLFRSGLIVTNDEIEFRRFRPLTIDEIEQEGESMGFDQTLIEDMIFERSMSDRPLLPAFANIVEALVSLDSPSQKLIDKDREFAKNCLDPTTGGFRATTGEETPITLGNTRDVLVLIKTALQKRFDKHLGFKNALKAGFFGRTELEKIRDHARTQLREILDGNHNIIDLHMALLIIWHLSDNEKDFLEADGTTTKKEIAQYLKRCFRPGDEPSYALFPDGKECCLTAIFFAIRIARRTDLLDELREALESTHDYVVNCWSPRGKGFAVSPNKNPNLLHSFFALYLDSLSEIAWNLDEDIPDYKRCLKSFVERCYYGGGFGYRPGLPPNTFMTRTAMIVYDIMGESPKARMKRKILQFCNDLHDVEQGGYRAFQGFSLPSSLFRMS